MSVEINTASGMARIHGISGGPSVSAVTFIAKIKRLADTGAITPLLSIYDTTNDRLHSVTTTANGDSVVASENWGTTVSSTVGTLVTNDWADVALVGWLNSGVPTMRAYFRGNGGTTAYQDLVFSSGDVGQFVIGNNYVGGYFDGRFANVKVYNATLNASEIEAEFNSETPARSADLLIYNDFDGAGITEAFASTTDNTSGAWGATWNSDAGVEPTDVARNADMPSYTVSIPTLTGTDALPTAVVSGAAPGAPTIGACIVQSSSAISVAWSIGTGSILGHRVYASEAGSTRTVFATGAADATSAIMSGLKANTVYVIDVVAYNDSGESTASATSSKTTQAVYCIAYVESGAQSKTGLRAAVWRPPQNPLSSILGELIGEYSGISTTAAAYDATFGGQVCQAKFAITPPAGITVSEGQNLRVILTDGADNWTRIMDDAVVSEE